MDSFAFMKVNNFKHIITYLLLGIFIFIKVAGLHAISHYDDKAEDIEHCETCDFITTNNITPLLNNDIKSIELNNLEFFTQNVKSYYSSAYNNTITNDCLFYRPPPTLS